jgi:hypothetical protein
VKIKLKFSTSFRATPKKNRLKSTNSVRKFAHSVTKITEIISLMLCAAVSALTFAETFLFILIAL